MELLLWRIYTRLPFLTARESPGFSELIITNVSYVEHNNLIVTSSTPAPDPLIAIRYELCSLSVTLKNIPVYPLITIQLL